ncbi:hypothetical protein RHGRI_007100 [Rhododendron griersonianum]|uniref:Uncharacterized protein n=1 Tax=Rhododendron griersonianum TaxID=479676 RepID=A0AAV6KW12_9ERIC|nr:hypothetical protein RHGRI_007100 [Rhododendron griersonianum]
MEEEESFRTVSLTNQVPNCAAHSEPEKDDDEMDKADDDRAKKKKNNSVDDMEKHRNKNSEDRAKNNEEEAEKYVNNGLMAATKVRAVMRCQQLEASLSSEGDEIEEYIIASQEQEQMEIDKEVQNTIKACNALGIKFGDAGIKRMTKMIANEAKILKASLKNNSFAPLMRDE